MAIFNIKYEIPNVTREELRQKLWALSFKQGSTLPSNYEFTDFEIFYWCIEGQLDPDGVGRVLETSTEDE